MVVYKNYLANIEYVPQANSFYGCVLNIVDVITFQGSTISETLAAFEDSVEDYLDYCYEMGVPPC